jgi:hypothetical protein
MLDLLVSHPAWELLGDCLLAKSESTVEIVCEDGSEAELVYDFMERLMVSGKDVPAIPEKPDLLEWAVSRWREEVLKRPLGNIHRRTLDDTWRQVIRQLGGDDRDLVGPPHDELLESFRRFSSE